MLSKYLTPLVKNKRLVPIRGQEAGGQNLRTLYATCSSTASLPFLAICGVAPPSTLAALPEIYRGAHRGKSRNRICAFENLHRGFRLRAVQVLCIGGCQPAERTQNDALRGSPSLVTGIWWMTCTMQGAVYTYATAAASAAASACRKDICMHV